jgi:serine/threonine protein kinase
MNAEERLEELLLRWEELADAGCQISAEELCRLCPELADELQRRIDGLIEMKWLASPQTSQLASDTEPVPGYRLIQRIGKGGFAEVWKAVGPDGSHIALKFLPCSEKAATAELRSLEALKGFRHPNLLATLGFWQTAEYLVIAMELADRTLLDRFNEERARKIRTGIPGNELLEYFRQAADAIDYLQEKNVQHRDIKPQNLLLKGKRVKVADFGLARVLANSVTGHTGSMTVAYAAPEFFEGKTTRRSDQYCLAVTYCQLRGGKLPLSGNTAQVMAGHLKGTPDLLTAAQGAKLFPS